MGLWLDRGADLLVAQLAISKSGAAWLPFDADAPAHRVAECLKDAGAVAIVSGVLAYRARRDYEGTDVQRTAHDAAARYKLDTRIALAGGVVAVGAAIASYALWPRHVALPITAAIDHRGAAIGVSGRF